MWWRELLGDRSHVKAVSWDFVEGLHVVRTATCRFRPSGLKCGISSDTAYPFLRLTVGLSSLLFIGVHQSRTLGPGIFDRNHRPTKRPTKQNP
jgi:hypothetical protein